MARKDKDNRTQQERLHDKHGAYGTNDARTIPHPKRRGQ